MVKAGDKGLVGTIILIIIGLAALKYFLDFDIFEAADTEQGQGTLAYIKQIINFIWDIIEVPVTFVWSNIFWPILGVGWDNFWAFVEWSKQTADGGTCC